MENEIMNAVTITNGKPTTTSLKIAGAVLGIPPRATRRVNQPIRPVPSAAPGRCYPRRQSPHRGRRLNGLGNKENNHGKQKRSGAFEL